VTPSEFREVLGVHKTRMNGLSCGEEIMTMRSAVLIPCQRVTDRRADVRRTDVQPISITCFSIADARKNGTERDNVYDKECELRTRAFGIQHKLVIEEQKLFHCFFPQAKEEFVA